MRPSRAPDPAWRGWAGPPGERNHSVTSARLPAGVQVRSRLFPKTRSWFALDAPLELLSPLSVMRLVYGLGLVSWPASALALRTPGLRTGPVIAVSAATAAVWVVLLRVDKVSARGGQLLAVLALVEVWVLVWGEHGSGLGFAYMTFVVPVGVFVALFLGVRAVVGYPLLAGLGLWAAMLGSEGAGRAAAVAAITTVTTASALLTVLLLTRSARRQSTVDADTGLPNGPGLARHLASHRDRPGFVVAAVVLEGIGEAREALGYRVGTELLRRAVEDLGQVLPADAVIGRVDGDELVVTEALEDEPLSARRELDSNVPLMWSPDGAWSLARRLAQAISAGHYLVDGVEVALRAHVGLAVAPRDGTDVPELVRRASLSARRAASSGRVIAVWDGAHGAMTADDLALLSDLRLAGDRGELWLAYQPQMTPDSGQTVAVEALLRWSSPIHGNVPAGRFILLAERTGLIDRLGGWVLSEALDAQVRWRRAGIHMPVSVNLSAKTLTDPELPDRLLSELMARALPSTSLTVEVTETAAADLLQAVRLLRPLHDRGVRVSIDDFGTGYTSLAALPHLPLDELKVDQRFVMRSSTSMADEAIVRTVMELAHRLGLTAVAEGVEDEETLRRMASFGFDLLQGHHISRPLSEDDLMSFVASPLRGLHGVSPRAGGADLRSPGLA
ncbi:MAG: putative bifunctional diguanylate cyclase/phosphodiesterase [Acidimicrobiales bacterium]